jgi:type VI secretion system secreted protein Hcp
MNLFLEFSGAAKTVTGPISVVGESLDRAHPQTIELSGVELEIENPTTIGSASGGAGVGKAKFNPMTVTKAVDGASAALFQAMAMGAHFPTVKLYVRKAGSPTGAPTDYLVYQFNMVFITKMDVSAGSGDDAPRETIEMVYGAMQVTYTPQSPTGQLGKPSTAMWSQVTNTATLDIPGM